MHPKVNILGVNYTRISLATLLEEIEQSHRITLSPVPVDPLMIAWRDPYLLQVYNSYDYVLGDSFYVTLASRLLGQPLPEQIRGERLFTALLDMCARRSHSVYFLGSDEAANQKAEKKMAQAGIRNVGHYCPPKERTFRGEDAQAILRRINDARPDFLFVILGAPKQDVWIYENKDKVNARAIIPIGAAFDYYSGNRIPAPRCMQKTGLEWLFRLGAEPGRLYKRYARDLLFPFLILKQIYTQMRSSHLSCERSEASTTIVPENIEA